MIRPQKADIQDLEAPVTIEVSASMAAQLTAVLNDMLCDARMQARFSSPDVLHALQGIAQGRLQVPSF